MLHNVTVKREENKVLEEYWEMQALQKKPSSIGFHEKNFIELDHEPTPQEIETLILFMYGKNTGLRTSCRFRERRWRYGSGI